jgi:hypothetical protein
MLRNSLRACGILLDPARSSQTLRNSFRRCGILSALKDFRSLFIFAAYPIAVTSTRNYLTGGD